ncbi:hypothetical protein FHX82_000273 [Amycolatopsis bartoniae]|uniref:Uncharacterized protein n=1 Tax=Amycolatopsis bartoniae TaxID=941986 RepID=A0A8H9IVL4_9PSEU|nr:hypothetical protein [Amycolatopsis bartoniae]MBB2933253.1 hypothetical protein [Amycolatopsis bartoniae]TVT11762.1 hypothetical protein FNH07_00055 [Amycolatopsis bartoniae]GHF58184.1 hypothetical protein GCM10017566_34360 [Amycolatopsis bartoniae]
MIRYQLALLGHSQRWLPPSLLFAVLMGILYADPGSQILPQFAVSAGALTVVACWLTVALVDAEDPVQRLITRVHARRLSTVLGGIVGAVFACCVLLTVLPLAWSTVTFHGNSPGALGVGALAHFAGAATGIAIGLPCSRLLVPRIGYTVLIAPVALVVVLLVRQLPLLNPMLRALTSDTASAAPLALALATSAALLLLSATAVGAVTRRRS